MKERLQAFVETGPGVLQGLQNATGERITVQLEGPDDAVRRILDLGLRPILVDDDKGRVVRWYGPPNVPSFAEPGGYAALFADISLTILEGDRPVFMGNDLEPGQPEQ